MLTLLLNRVIYAIFIMKKEFYFKKLHFMTIAMPTAIHFAYFENKF